MSDFHFMCIDGSDITLTDRDFTRWSHVFSNMDLKVVLMEISRRSYQKPWLRRKTWFFQLSGYLYNREKGQYDYMEEIMPQHFYKTDNQYGRGIELEEYKGVFSLVSAKESADGRIFKEWAFPQDKDKKPRDKALPIKISLGDRKAAIKALTYILKELDGTPPANDEPPF